jgi:hypothetical protein
VYLKQLRRRAEKLPASQFQYGAKPELVTGMQKMCLYKQENFAWNGTLPSKQTTVWPDGRGSTS